MYLAHIPINHHLRPLYRALAGLAGLYLVGFGVVGLIRAGGWGAFEQEGLPKILGQQVNLAHAIVAILLGAAVVVGTVMGRNIDHYISFWVGQLLLIIGLAMLTVLRTDANILGFNMTNVIVTFVVGVVILAASFYTKIGSAEAVEAERAFAERAAAAKADADRSGAERASARHSRS